MLNKVTKKETNKHKKTLIKVLVPIFPFVIEIIPTLAKKHPDNGHTAHQQPITKTVQFLQPAIHASDKNSYVSVQQEILP